MQNRITQGLIKALNLEPRDNRVEELQNMANLAVIQERDPKKYLEDLILFGHPKLGQPKVYIFGYLSLPDKNKTLADYILGVEIANDPKVKVGKNYIFVIKEYNEVGDFPEDTKLIGYSVRALVKDKREKVVSIIADIELPFKGEIKIDSDALQEVIINYLQRFRKSLAPHSYTFGSYFIDNGIKIDSVTVSQISKKYGITLEEATNIKPYAEILDLKKKKLEHITPSSRISEIDFDTLKMLDFMFKCLIPDAIVLDRHFNTTIFGNRNRTMYGSPRGSDIKISKLYCSK